jgi:hypothetical protein
MIYFIYVLLILLISFIPNLNRREKTRLSILVNNNISKILILLVILFLLLEDYTLGLLLLILYFTILIYKLDSIEGFQTYFN